MLRQKSEKSNEPVLTKQCYRQTDVPRDEQMDDSYLSHSGDSKNLLYKKIQNGYFNLHLCVCHQVLFQKNLMNRFQNKSSFGPNFDQFTPFRA